MGAGRSGEELLELTSHLAARYRATFEQAAVGIAEVGLDGRWIKTNSRLCEIVGYSSEELDGLTFQDITHPDDLGVDLGHVHDLINGKCSTFSMEKRYIRKNGTVVWALLTVALVRTKLGEPDYFISVVEDIDEGKRAARERDELLRRERVAREQAQEAAKLLERERNLLKLFVDHAPAQIAMFDREMRYVSASRRWLADYGLSESVIGKSYYEVLPEIAERWREVHRRALAGAVLSADEDALPRVDGTIQWIKWEIRPWYDADGAIGGVVIAGEDVSGRVQTRRELEASVRFAEQFIGMLGHDLRNPLNAITVAASLLERKGDGENSKSIERILASANRMSNMVAQLLDLTRSRLGGGIVVDRKLIKLDEVVRSAVDELKQVHPMREIQCALTPDVRGEWDAERLAQVVSNLVGNAIQYGDSARPVEVRLTTREREAVLEVRSFGPPISPDLLPVIFEPYRRGEARSSKARGLGLGLFISHQIVLAHGGRMQVNSSADAGTTFAVLLPWSAAPGAEVEPGA
jgi:PAS domain S-box-containing protein